MTIPSLVESFYSRIWNGGDMAAIDEIVAENVLFRGSLGQELRGREEFRRYVESVRGALAGYRCDVLDCVAEHNRAFAKMRFSGRHIKPFRGFSATGKTLEWFGAALFAWSDSRISSVWVVGDLSSLDEALRGQPVRGAATTNTEPVAGA